MSTSIPISVSISVSSLALCALAATACQSSGTETLDIELIVVGDQLRSTASYDIDLTREEAVYYIEPGLDIARLRVTCPTLASMPFSEYIVDRIRPTGVSYDPATEGLQLANALVPRAAYALMAYRITPNQEVCVKVCTDDSSGRETCDPEPICFPD